MLDRKTLLEMINAEIESTDAFLEESKRRGESTQMLRNSHKFLVDLYDVREHLVGGRTLATLNVRLMKTVLAALDMQMSDTDVRQL